MSARIRLILACVASLGLMACAELGTIFRVAGVSAPDVAALVVSPEVRERHEKCQQLGQLPVNLAEEQSFGDAVAVALAHRAGGVFFDVDEPLEVLKTGQTPRLRATPANTLTRYLNLVGQNLAARSARPELTWRFAVLKSESVNAFSAPGGYVFVTRGLLRKVTSEAELAGVLAHEIAHVTERHALQDYQTVKAAQCETLAVAQGSVAAATRTFGRGPGNGAADAGTADGGTVAEGTDPSCPLASIQRMLQNGGSLDLNKEENFEFLRQLVPQIANFILDRGFEAQKEFTADQVGLELVVNAGYNPNEYIKFLGKLQDSKEILSTHPPAQQRQGKLTDWLRDEADAQKEAGLYDSTHPFESYPVVPLRDELAAAR